MPLLAPRLVAVVALALVSALTAMAVAADLPVAVERLHGEVAVIQDQPGETLQAGTQVHTGMDGRAELSMGGAPSLFVGGDSQLLLHSADGDVLRVRLLKGSMRADTRASGGQPRRDLRLNAGDMQLRIADGELWIEHAEGQTQVCSIAGAAEVQVDSRRDRLDFPGQCVRRAGVETAWTLVPPEILSARVEQVSLPRATPTDVAQPAAPAPTTPVAAVSPPATAPSSAVQAAAAASPPAPPELVAPEIASAESAVAAPPPELAPSPSPSPSESEPPAAALAADANAPLIAPTPASIEHLTQTLAQAEALADARNAAVASPAAADGTAAADEIGAETEAVVEVETEPEAQVDPNSESAESTDIARSELDPVAAAEVEAAVMTAPTHSSASESVPVISAPETAVAAVEEVDDGRRWSVVLASMSTREAADHEVERLRGMGLQPEAREYRVGERSGFRVGMGRYGTREGADAALRELQSTTPALPGWVAKY